MATLISSTRLLTPIGFFAISANFAVGTTHRPRPSPSKQFCSIYWFRGSEKYFFIFSKSRCICQTGICLAMDRLMAFTLKDPAVKLFRAPSPRWLSLLFCNKESTKKPFSFLLKTQETKLNFKCFVYLMLYNLDKANLF